MDKIVIQGGKTLKGDVQISGAKNAALPILAAALLTEGENIFHNIPDLVDIKTIKKLLAGMGAQMEGGQTLKIGTENITNYTAPYELVKTMRASILVLGPLVARAGRARVSLPGGCAIGARPVNLHIKALQALGAEVELNSGYIEARAKKLKGTDIYFDIPTVTGTENVMMAATLAEGTTVLNNAACEPEIVNLAEVLQGMGAKIRGAGTDVITVEGVTSLHPTEASIIPDRIEAGTFMIAAGMTQGEINVRGCNPNHLESLINKLRETGMKITPIKNGLKVSAGRKINSVDIKTLPYPGFPTDLQAQMMAYMTIAGGLSVITETVFENRFMHVSELKRMGARIKIDGRTAIIEGGVPFMGAQVKATDLRAGAALILAGLCAKDRTEISDIFHIDRGYEKMEQKLKALGAKISRL